ncbi:DUF4129 domain-containing protein [Aetokthonos hydrillicola]|uniref:DUF4129 domain-containing protein n=1 Tax=Aetokthonos hydrillicola TaxID=1550245 RepID=UPI0028773519|nr:DUF4129 domain-containing protein [Aetokthonos hydrillicola]
MFPVIPLAQNQLGILLSIDTFEKTNLFWQFSLLEQQVGEWLEYQFSRLHLDTPEWSLGRSIASWLNKLLNFLFWILLGLFLAWLVWRLWQKLSPDFDSWLTRVRSYNGKSAKTAESGMSEKVWLARSQELYQKGNYREACRCVYFAMLHYLHAKAILPDKSSRTDGEYLQLLQLSGVSMQPYETLITTHEQICFRDTEVHRENYEQCQQAYREISQQ